MTPKEKAEDLLNRFWNEAIPDAVENNKNVGIKCALICVDEIISACEYNHVEPWNTDWWNKVKQELENL